MVRSFIVGEVSRVTVFGLLMKTLSIVELPGSPPHEVQVPAVVHDPLAILEQLFTACPIPGMSRKSKASTVIASVPIRISFGFMRSPPM